MATENTRLTAMLGLEHPLIMAPMFLVSNVAMVEEGMRCGVAGCIPALNYRTLDELRTSVRALKAAKAAIGKGAFGYNLIVNKSNPKAMAQLEALCEEGCDFIIYDTAGRLTVDEPLMQELDRIKTRLQPPNIFARMCSRMSWPCVR